VLQNENKLLGGFDRRKVAGVTTSTPRFCFAQEVSNRESALRGRRYATGLAAVPSGLHKLNLITSASWNLLLDTNKSRVSFSRVPRPDNFETLPKLVVNLTYKVYSVKIIKQSTNYNCMVVQIKKSRFQFKSKIWDKNC
jgi:hypothetical protein